MKNYFLTGFSKEKIREAGVECHSMQIEEENGFIVDESGLSILKEKYRLLIYDERNTTFEGIYHIILEEENEMFKNVKIKNWNGENKSEFASVLKRELLPIVKKNIILSTPHGENQKVINDDNFYVWIWSAPKGEREDSAPKKIWGIDVDCRDVVFSPLNYGYVIYDDNNYPVAELIQNNLYIFHDLCHNGTKNEIDIFRKLLKAVIEELALSPEERSKRDAESNRDKYIKECTHRLKKEIEDSQIRIVNGEKEIKEHQKQIVKNIRLIKTAQKFLDSLISCKNQEKEKYGLEYDNLCKVKKVIDVKVAKNKVAVYTDVLYCTDPRTELVHEIGKFKIDIYSKIENSCVRWYNLTRRVEGYREEMSAPHIFSDGKACLGSAEEIFPELIANYEFAVAAMIAIQFVETVNVDDDAGRHIDQWPLAPIEMQTVENKVLLKQREDNAKNNPFRNCKSDLAFVRIGKSAVQGTRFNNCGNCYCWKGEKGKCSVTDLANALKIDIGSVYSVLTAYFKL